MDLNETQNLGLSFTNSQTLILTAFCTRRGTMNRMISSVLTASALIFGVSLPKEEAAAQTAKELVGMWTLVSVTLEQDGKKTDMYGANPQGQAIFAPNGRFSIMFIRSDIPKFASSNREAG